MNVDRTTPTILARLSFRIISRPTTSKARANAFVHSSSLMTTAGSDPALSSVGARTRPTLAVPPSAWK
jgi:hypothetical protein